MAAVEQAYGEGIGDVGIRFGFSQEIFLHRPNLQVARGPTVRGGNRPAGARLVANVDTL
jgi:hypothetical protein